MTRDPTPPSTTSASAKPTDPPFPQRATVTTNEIVIPRVAHPAVVLDLPVVDVGDAKENAAIAALLAPEKILDASIDDVRDDAKKVKSATDLAYGVQGCTFEVTYDAHGILQIDASTETWGAYPSFGGYHAVIDLKGGTLIHANEAFVASKTAALVARLDAKVVAEAKSSAAAKDPVWSATVADAHFTPEDLDTFSVRDDGVTFFHDYGFPHAALALAPPGSFFQSWSELGDVVDPSGPLARVMNAKS